MKIKIIAVLVAAALAALLIVKLTSSDDLEAALSAFADEDYQTAIEKLNRFIPLADYEAGEKIYYYRAKALNGLAVQLEERFSKELKEAAADSQDTAEFKKAEEKINRKLKSINEELGSDLEFIPDNPVSRIFTKGRFQDEFVSKYKGSGLIEDLDFEQLSYSVKSQEGDKPVRSILRFYQKYPNTPYIGQLVKMIFAQLQKGEAVLSEISEEITDILAAYGRRYPTGPELNLIYTCVGDGVNIRNSPGVNAQRVGNIPSGAVLLQLEKSMDMSQVGDVRNYWYRVSDLTGQKGWIFGKFLKPFDVTDYSTENPDIKWTLNENFTSWSDSNTPENWRHIDEAGKTGISFVNSGAIKKAILNSGANMRTGLFARYNASKAFSLASKARYTGGDGFILFAYSLGKNGLFCLTIKNDEIDVCGRIIPLHTNDWHDYRLESMDGRFAALSVDGEILSGRISPINSPDFSQRGIYALCSEPDKNGKGEIEYIRAQ